MIKKSRGLSRAQSRGFTLIELMVVVLIIMLLAAAIIVNVDQARKKARDAKRISDLNTVASALQAYYADNHFYPLNRETAYDLGTPFPVSGTMIYPQLMLFMGFTNRYLTSCPRDPLLTVNDNPCFFNSFGALHGCDEHGCPIGSNPYGYRYTCWDDNNDGVENSCVSYSLGAAVELDTNATIRTGTNSGKPEYRIFLGEPCYSTETCSPPACWDTGTCS